MNRSSKIHLNLVFIALLTTSCQVRDPIPLRPGDETTKYLDKKSQKQAGATKPVDPTSIQHALMILERQSQVAQLLTLAETLEAQKNLNPCLRVQKLADSTSMIDLNNCLFDYDQVSHSQYGRFIIHNSLEQIRIETLSQPDSLRLQTKIRKSGKPTFIKEDFLLVADKKRTESGLIYQVNTFTVYSQLASRSENTTMNLKASGILNVISSDKGLQSDIQFVNWRSALTYQSDMNGGTDWTMNIEMKDDQDFHTETLSSCGTRKAHLKLTYNYKPADSKVLAELTFDDNTIAFAKEPKPSFILAPDCMKSGQPGVGILALPWGRIIQ